MWNWSFFFEILPQLLGGFVVTLQLTFISYAFALTVGLVWAIARMAPQPWLAKPIGHFVEFVRSTPILVQLYFLYYVLPDVGIKLSAFLTGILGLGLHYSTYVAEIYRSGIEAVPKGQWEAARALHLDQVTIWRRIILPQALPPVIPALGNRLIALFKQTPLLAAITVSEMLLVAQEIGAERFSYIEPYTGVGLLFLIASLISAAGVHLLEKRYGSSL